MVASQGVHQPLERALWIAQVDLQQAFPFGREGTDLLLLYPHERLHILVHDLNRRGPQEFQLVSEGSDRGVWWRGEEVRAAALHAHSGYQRRQVCAREGPPRAGRPGRVHRVAPVVKQHSEARNRFPQRAGREADFGEVFGGERYRDHGVQSADNNTHNWSSALSWRVNENQNVSRKLESIPF